jgi:hypothetical protein
MSSDFDDFAWHDATLVSLAVPREQPGESDRIVIVVSSSDSEVHRFTFLDCYAFEASMNFGIVAEETIRSARRTQDSEELDALRTKWETAGADLAGLQGFELSTNSTNSTLRIYAMRCRREKQGEGHESAGHAGP